VIGRFLSWLSGDTAYVNAMNARMAAMDAQAKQAQVDCEICNGLALYLCPLCHEPIENHSHENDFMCSTHGFIHPIRSHDGARIDGNGTPGPLRVMA